MRRELPFLKRELAFLWIGGYCALPLAAVILAALLLSGCSSVQRTPPFELWPDMKHQPRFTAQHETDLFSDHRQSRRPPEGTVARAQLSEDTPYYTGMESSNLYVGKIPVPITLALLEQGQTKFNIYCTPCHDKEGYGKGIVPVRVLSWQPSNLMEDRIVQAADGDIFNVITNGRRSMPAYRFQITVEDRWAIISYLRVLQRAHHSSLQDVPEEQRTELR